MVFLPLSVIVLNIRLSVVVIAVRNRFRQAAIREGKLTFVRGYDDATGVSDFDFCLKREARVGPLGCGAVKVPVRVPIRLDHPSYPVSHRPDIPTAIHAAVLLL